LTLDIEAEFDKVIQDDSEDFGAPESFRFSDIGKCHRYQILKRRNEVAPEPFTVDTRILFKFGNIIEPVVLKWLSKVHGIQIISRTDGTDPRTGKPAQIKAAAPEYDARGSLDALGIADGEIFPVEVKSTRSRALQFGLPFTTHDLQATAYALFLGLRRSLIVYLGRDGGRRLLWVYVTNEKEQLIKREWAKLATWLLSDELPPVKPKIQATKKVKGVNIPFVYEVGPNRGEPKMELDSECSRCSYLNYCWPRENAGGEEVPTPD